MSKCLAPFLHQVDECGCAPAEPEHGLWCPDECSCGGWTEAEPAPRPSATVVVPPLLKAAYELQDPIKAAEYLRADRADRMLRGPDALYRFLEFAWPEIEPGVAFEGTPLLQAVCQHTQLQLEEHAIASGWQEAPEWVGWTGEQRARNQLIRIPPRTAKTLAVTVAGSAWAWLRWPQMTIFSLSSNPRVITTAADKVRTLIRSARYQETFRPAWQIRPDMDALAKIGNTAGGWRQALGWYSRVTGDGGDWMIIDDPHDGDEVFSKAKREGVLRRWDSALSSRIKHPRRSIVTGVMQALHPEDWGQERIAEGWGLLLIRMAYEPSRPRRQVGMGGVWVEADDDRVSPYGYRDWRIGGPVGALVSARFDAKWAALAQLKPLVWSAQQQQDPASSTGNLIKIEHLCSWEVLPSKFDEVSITVDAAFKKTVAGSRVSVQGWGRVGPDRYLIENETRPMHLEETIAAIESVRGKLQARGLKVRRTFIEDKANGSEIIRRLRFAVPGVVAVNPGDNSKEGRLMACLEFFQGRNVYIPLNAPWREDLVAEWTQFPNWPKDDQVDAAVQILLEWREPSSLDRARAMSRL